MGNASSGPSAIFDCAVNPLDLEGDADESIDCPTVLEAAVPLRDSVLWSMQASFYERMGVRAWSEGHIPHFVTSNAFIARSYARMVLSALCDTAAAAPDGR